MENPGVGIMDKRVCLKDVCFTLLYINQDAKEPRPATTFIPQPRRTSRARECREGEHADDMLSRGCRTCAEISKRSMKPRKSFVYNYVVLTTSLFPISGGLTTKASALDEGSTNVQCAYVIRSCMPVWAKVLSILGE